MGLIRALWKRLSLFQRVALIGVLLFVAFVWAGGGLIGNPLPCAPTPGSPAAQVRECTRTLSAQFAAVRTAFCDAQGSCSADAGAPPIADLEGLQDSLSALPLGWAQPGLFAQPTRLTLAPGTQTMLIFDAVAGDRSVAVGRLRLTDGAALDVRSTVSVVHAGDTVRHTCTMRLTARPAPGQAVAQPETRLALAAAARTEITLACPADGTPCGLLLDNGSADLARDSQCQRE